MQEALVIKQPKWLPFEHAKAEFKSLSVKEGETAVLVYRENVREKDKQNAVPLKSGKTADWLKTQAKEVVEKLTKSAKAAAAFAIFMLAMTVSAQQEISTTLYTTSITRTNTNDGAAMQWRPGDIYTIQGVVSYNAADTNSVIFTLDESLGAGYWTTGTQTFELSAANGTNTTVSLLQLTNTLGTLWWKISQIEVASTNTASIRSLLIYKAD